MEYISNKLANRFGKDPKAARRLRDQIACIKDDAGSLPDPLHAAYVRAQNLTSVFAEGISPLPEMEPYYDAAASAEDEFMPSGPPMSPLTGSYFTTWAFFDLRFGRDFETIGTILLDLSEYAGLSPTQYAVVREFQQSRMGIYEHDGAGGARVRLRELLTDDEFTCVVPAGHIGRKGELWYVRLCPPLPGYDYHIAFTTPYLLRGASKADWIAYLGRSLDKTAGDETKKKLFHLMKFGLHPNGWPEFVLQAYAGHETSAIYLTGLPDQPQTLPHVDSTGKRRCG